MTRIAIQGVGVVGGFGCGVDDLARALVAGTVPTAEVAPNPGDESFRLPVYLADPSPLEAFLPKRALRRIDHFSRLALLGAHLALKDAGLLEADRQRLGVVIATGYGATRTTFSFLDTVIDDGDPCASPTHFSNSVHNAAAAHVAIQLKATGPSLTVSQFEMSVPSALLAARQMLEEGRVDRVLFGAVDEYCAVLGYCWERFFGADTSGKMEPLDFARQSAVAGEGAAFFVLGRQGEGEAPYGFIEETGLGNLAGGSPVFSGRPAFFLGADGRRRCSAPYADIVPAGATVAAYGPLYGSLPVAPAFDLAIAALAVRDGRLCASPGAKVEAGDWKLLGAEDLGRRSICCLKTDATGGYGFFNVVGG